MFQNFTVTSTPETGAARLKMLRGAIKTRGLDGFLVPRADAHQGENVAACDERLAWLTGFTGSAGHCAVLADIAGVFVDGRYTLQVRSQVDQTVFTPQSIPDDKLSDWLITHLPKGGAVGYDPMLHSFDNITKLAKSLEPHKITLTQTDNIVDAIWQGQPSPPQGKVTAYPIEFSGVSSADKRAGIAQTLKENDLLAAVLTLPDSIAWLLNIRGNDVANTPVALAFAVIHADASVDLFIDPAKIDSGVTAHLGPDIRIKAPAKMESMLSNLAGSVGVDRTSAPYWMFDRISDPIWLDDPCILPKARKNPVELDGTRTAHLRDAAAMCEFLAWVDRGVTGKTEIDVVQQLEGFRRNTNALTDISFETICGSGPNGAIVHYRVDEASNRTIGKDELLLVDSGGQYLDGTTDITRTVIIGTPDSEMTRAFTLVLKGMIALSMARWPVGLAGCDLDGFARAPLWQAGMDYDHGTGHGVGAYLSVHEGPQRISRAGTVPLEPGMILSNEPGYYAAGKWGIRIENLVVVDPPSIPHGGNRDMLGFETITWVPIDRRLINPTLLTRDESDWINGYHKEVEERLVSKVSPETQVWLSTACAPI